ncbi:hypothetical protein SIID45300_00975 [Candidatus Magnetaquicoccaceae bacterium FCR-1]|uniref:Uncharacterized protein n=1 Tax=Candidatus Magnetaquiglobus chichijimensis TaxID=3141448 RepID=A0ABQ0C714_9PROT
MDFKSPVRLSVAPFPMRADLSKGEPLFPAGRIPWFLHARTRSAVPMGRPHVIPSTALAVAHGDPLAEFANNQAGANTSLNPTVAP